MRKKFGLWAKVSILCVAILSLYLTPLALACNTPKCMDCSCDGDCACVCTPIGGPGCVNPN